MKKISDSYKIYFLLIIILAFFAAFSVFLPQNINMVNQQLPASKVVLSFANAAIIIIFYGGIGFVGLVLSRKIGFVEIWDNTISNKERFIKPLIIGIFLGILFIISDLIFVNFHNLGLIMHPPFPISIIASITAAIGEEILFRLFFISFWVWLISDVLRKNKWMNQIFWIIVFFSALLFTVSHIPSIIFLYNLRSFWDLPIPLLIELFVINGSLSFIAAYYFRKYGILAAIGIHFWADIIWHVIWGII